ncbi:MAG TPA: FUN14 domain-containing protein [Candidatus Babeliales bacterium]|jgi:uncharacterized membrane protein (Fun14 family)|nr:FUN14 domain-containing protein [Candidatus Babeliales bacterium]
MLNEGQVSNTGLIETLKNAMQPEVIANKIGMDKNVLIDIGLYGAIGFITGFLLKKYSEYFIALVLFVVGVVVLQQFDYMSVSINLPKIHQMLGLQSVPMVGDKYGAMFLEWIKANVAGSASFAVGFLIGLKVG